MGKREQRRKKHTILRTLLIGLLCLLFFTTGAVVAGVILSKEETVVKETQKQIIISLSETCIARAGIWLSGVEESSWDYEKLQETFSNLEVVVGGEYQEESDTWTWTVSEESYLACEQLAYEDLGKLFQEILVSQGGLTECSETELEEGLTQILGMPLVDYLKTCDISLMPSKEAILADLERGDKEVMDSEK